MNAFARSSLTRTVRGRPALTAAPTAILAAVATMRGQAGCACLPLRWCAFGEEESSFALAAARSQGSGALVVATGCAGSAQQHLSPLLADETASAPQGPRAAFGQVTHTASRPSRSRAAFGHLASDTLLVLAWHGLRFEPCFTFATGIALSRIDEGREQCWTAIGSPKVLPCCTCPGASS